MTLAPDEEPPSTPTGLAATPISQSQINLSWNPSTDNIGVVKYNVYYADGTFIQEVTTTSASITGLDPETEYCFKVSAEDAAGNESDQSAQACATTLEPCIEDTEDPSVPTGLTATAVSTSQIDLSWNPSTDDCGIDRYRVYDSDGITILREVAETSTSFTGLNPGTEHCFSVSAIDTSENESAQSTQACATTQTVGLNEGNATKAYAATNSSLYIPIIMEDLAFQTALIVERGISGIGASSVKTKALSTKTKNRVSPKELRKHLKALSTKGMLKQLSSGSKTPRQRTGVVTVRDTAPDITIQCNVIDPGSGTAMLTNIEFFEDASSFIIDASATITYDNCSPINNVVLHGTMQIAYEGDIYLPTKVTMSTDNLTYTDTFAGDDLTFTSFSIEISDIEWHPAIDIPVAYTLTINGSVSGTVGGVPINTQFQDFQITFSANDEFDETWSLSGNMIPACLGFMVSVVTNTDLFVPIEEICPTAGETVLSQNGNNVTVSFASSKEITVSFNSSPVQTFTDCTEGVDLCGS
jgi:chitodextrinase